MNFLNRYSHIIGLILLLSFILSLSAITIGSIIKAIKVSSRPRTSSSSKTDEIVVEASYTLLTPMLHPNIHVNIIKDNVRGLRFIAFDTGSSGGLQVLPLTNSVAVEKP